MSPPSFLVNFNRSTLSKLAPPYDRTTQHQTHNYYPQPHSGKRSANPTHDPVAATADEGNPEDHGTTHHLLTPPHSPTPTPVESTALAPKFLGFSVSPETNSYTPENASTARFYGHYRKPIRGNARLPLQTAGRPRYYALCP